MSVLSRLLDWMDTPRFCPDDGKEIEVENIGAYNERTGAAEDDWIWHCPGVSTDDGRVWTQRGDRVHIHGHGQPRWHRADREEPTHA